MIGRVPYEPEKLCVGRSGTFYILEMLTICDTYHAKNDNSSIEDAVSEEFFLLPRETIDR
jgi:hypothetical protein